jgi:predicted DNA-binding transcriptional regulator YafY
MTKDRRTITPAEERALIASTERGEWRSVGRIEERRESLRTAAQRKLDQINGELIRKAIIERRLLSLTYKSSERYVEPYILGYDSRNDLLLSAVQVAGGSGKGFRTFRVSEMSNVSLTDKRFYKSHPDYDPRDPLFEKLFEVFEEIVEKIAA